MEPMTLGSPSGSPAANVSGYLPNFLLGDTPTNPRNTLSPNKGNFSYALSPSAGINSSQDYNRTSIGQRTLFSNVAQSPTAPNFSAPHIQNHNTNISGPPTTSLFDSLHNERNQVHTPSKSTLQQQHQQNLSMSMQNLSGLCMTPQTQINDSCFNNANASYAISATSPRYFTSPLPNTTSYSPTGSGYWVTVFGFPPSATNIILQHFAQCGTIVDKVFPAQNGNWVHLKYTSRMECDKALNYNEKILGNNIMIGVTFCKDQTLADKENVYDAIQPMKVRPLAQTAYTNAQIDAVVPSLSAPQKTSGLVNKAIDLLFGW